MPQGDDRVAFEVATVAGEGVAQAEATAASLRSGASGAARELAAAALHVAAARPEATAGLYDGLCRAWFGRAPDAASVPVVDGDPPATEISGAFFEALWALVDDPRLGRDPAAITSDTVALVGLLPADLVERVAASARRFPGVSEAASGGLPGRFALEDLGRSPDGSLGRRLHDLVVDQGFDLEVLDRQALGLSSLPPPLDYLNTRILQCHDVWHEVAGYETTGLHEIAISAFQLGQFGHHYSAMFLGVALTTAAFGPEGAMGFLLDTILSAYRHGRESPPLLGVVWEDLFDLDVADVRRSLGLSPYHSPYPPGVLETLRSR